MTEIVVAQRMWQRRGTPAEWTAVNPILESGEIGVELHTLPDPHKAKIGNGIDTWVNLPYFAAGAGKSAYQIAVDNGYVGTEAEWLESLQSDGGSAYEIAVVNGYVGTEAQWLASLQGEDGDDGASAYEIALAGGYVGTEAQWVASLKGEPGDDGVVTEEIAQDAVPVSIIGGVATLDCALGLFFTLNLSADATVSIVNHSPGANCVILRVLQAGGRTLALQTGANTISTIPYSATPEAGAVDVLGFMSVDSGASFLVAVSQRRSIADGGSAPPEEVLAAGFDGALAEAYGTGTSGPTGGAAWITFKRDGTWECWAASTSDGITAAGVMTGSGNWYTPTSAAVGDGYEVLFAPTTGGGGTASNGAATYAALTTARTFQLEYERNTVGSNTVARSIAVTVREIANPGNTITGTMGVSVTGDNS